MVQGGLDHPLEPPPGSSASEHAVKGESMFLQRSEIPIVFGWLSQSNICTIATILFGTP